MGIFEQLTKVKASGGGRRYLKQGTHRIRVDKVEFGKSRTGVEFFAVAGTLIASNSSDPDMAVGNSVDWSTHADKDAYWGNVKQFICAATGTMERQFDELDAAQGNALIDAISGPRQALTGTVLDAVCIDQTSRAGNQYTAVRWQNVPTAQVQAQAPAA